MTGNSEANGINRNCCCGCGGRVVERVMHTCSITKLPVFAGYCLSKEATAKAPCVRCQAEKGNNNNNNNNGSKDDDIDGDGDNNYDNDEDKGNISLILLSSSLLDT